MAVEAIVDAGSCVVGMLLPSLGGEQGPFYISRARGGIELDDVCVWRVRNCLTMLDPGARFDGAVPGVYGGHCSGKRQKK